MKSYFINPLPAGFLLIFAVFLSSCGTNDVKGTIVTDSSANAVVKKDTAMPHEPVNTVIAASDSVTPDARTTTKDSIGSKISIHHGEIKVIDTTKKDKRPA